MEATWPTGEEIRALIETQARREGLRPGSESWDLAVDDMGEAIYELRLSAKGDPKMFREALARRYGGDATKAFSIHDLATHEIPVPTAEEMKAE